MNRLQWIALAAVSVVLAAACKNGTSTNLPEPVGETQPQASAARPGESLPSNHPALSPAGPGDQAVNRPLPPGTRNPMEDIVAFKARLEKNPKDLEALISLGNANTLISRFDAAQDLYTRALAINPKDLEVRSNLAYAYARSGKTDQALAELQKNLSYDPDDGPTLLNLGSVHASRGDRVQALAMFKRWLTLYPGAPDAADVAKQIAQLESEGASANPAAQRPGS